ncbi:MAG TPA: triose-phosphate isomerase [candidate division Zixibacteria bacterium]|nr:triose-phosphate isomerase [candidate division Zixibacteria bacterium]
MRPLIVGNWKMHGTQAGAFRLARAIARSLQRRRPVAEVVLAPPFTALAVARTAIRRGPIRLAGQNCCWQEAGAFTGEVSPVMLRDLGCAFVILGHSERRRLFGENDRLIAQKLAAARKAGLRPILCVGETLAERRKGLTGGVVTRQLNVALKGLDKNDIGKVEIAYEPVWAIGTGRNATPEQVGEVHRRIRRWVERFFGAAAAGQTRILYGGSVNAENAPLLASVPEVNGFLVGGASLQAGSFLSIVRCYGDR